MAALDVCNRALIKMGNAALITDLTDTAVPQAVVLNAVYANLRDALQQAFTWNFATKRAALVVTTAPAFGYDYAFTAPTDMLRAIIDDPENADYRVEASKILTNASAINLVYIAQITDTTKFSPLFMETLVAYIAAETCEAITANTNQAIKLKREFEDMFTRAKKADSQEGTAYSWRQSLNRRP